MIRHICMFKLKEENKEENKKEFLKRAEGLRVIEQIKSFEVVENAVGTPENNYDVSLIFDFNSIEDLKIYQDSPIHKEFGVFVGTIRETRACIDYNTRSI